MQEVRDLHEEVRQFLQAHTRMVLAIDDDGRCPNTSLMHYILGENSFALYIGTRKSFAKYALLQRNRCAACLITEDTPDPVRVVSIHASIEEISEGIENELAQSILRANNRTTWYVDGSDDLKMFALRPMTIKYLNGSSGKLEVHDIPVS